MFYILTDMKISGSDLVHLTGDVAYMIYWESVYKFSARLSEVKSKDTNLEIIVTNQGDLLAYHHDGISDIKDESGNTGGWNLFNDENLTPLQKNALVMMIEKLNQQRDGKNKSDLPDISDL